VAYWLAELGAGRLDRGGVVLYVALSPELASRHPYPSDDVPARSCLLPDGRLSGRGVHLLDPGAPPPLATVAGLTLAAPAAVIERAGFHQSSHPGAQALSPSDPAPVRLTTLPSRQRGTHERSAIDVVVEPGTPILAPVSGTVVRAGSYRLYCRYHDSYLVIAPDGRPDLELKVLHVRDLAVRPGQRVETADRVAGRANQFTFRSQVDSLTAQPSWPHVHLEVVDPSVPRPPSSGC
jgi:murein DD-endopeptidase MepM/ murein hydrolase activator NlpD